MDVNAQLQEVRIASRLLLRLKDETIAEVLNAVADEIINRTDVILTANQEDLKRMDPANPKYDRLKLTKERL
jgi:glutamate-5-semialdehyde dehydrogenase